MIHTCYSMYNIGVKTIDSDGNMFAQLFNITCGHLHCMESYA